MRIHTYAAGGGGAQTLEVEPDTKLREILLVETDERVYQVGGEVEVDLEVSVLELFGEGPGHVVRHTCRDVAVTVAYAGAERMIRVHPAAHLRKVRVEAIKEFGIPEADAADLALRLPGTEQNLSLSEPVGAVVPKGTCSVALDLVHTVRPQGRVDGDVGTRRRPVPESFAP